MTRATLEKELFSLPATERAELADALWRSVEDDTRELSPEICELLDERLAAWKRDPSDVLTRSELYSRTRFR